MELYELKEHCREQLEKLPRASKMYEEHLLVLALIATNKKYFEELEEKKKQIELMAEFIDNYDGRTIKTFEDEEHIKDFLKKIAEREEK